ncbi:tRNA modification GTPase MnmE [Poriferisphaera corsica]|uniref:tRNA modification GTPase MnmE n=1 Tax=Poriferisphaera corsica TaxID=2528020 RepID=A0A517YVA8_9BACT|nr:GTPase [Poriferisphaera corsica]QDU34171.1 tRNA modification GTPase MnmE [Poriferisphaera corsica]
MRESHSNLNSNASARSHHASTGCSLNDIGKLNRSETIVAVSSAPGQSARGLVRLSGNDAVKIALKLCDFDSELKERTICVGKLKDLGFACAVTFLPGPGSYTGDDTIEVQLPSHPALLEFIMQRSIGLGARLAEPGEFTFRAFACGKLDLTQAEGIAATISAASDGQLHAAEMLKNGKLGSFAFEIVNHLSIQLALVEAGIDFVDQEDVIPIKPNQLESNLNKIWHQLQELLKASRSWGAVESMPRVVLVGEPSVGKSTLFNAMLGKPRAVISAMPGTTRDILAEPTMIHSSLEVMLIDIAGLDHVDSSIDEHAQEAAQQAIDGADLVLCVSDPSCKQSFFDHIAPRTPKLYVQNKSDLFETSRHTINNDQMIQISALEHTGLEHLRKKITAHLRNRATSAHAEQLTLQPRHEAAIRSTIACLQEAIDLLENQINESRIFDIELIASAMREALDEMAALGGEMTPDDVIGHVFSSFCVGK